MTDTPTPTAPETELLPCPFCGGVRIKAHHIRDGRSLGCMDCGAAVHKFNGPTDITDALMAKWNRRAPNADLIALRAEVATLRASEARLREALAVIAAADTTEFDEDEGCDVTVAMCEEEMAKIARAAINDSRCEDCPPVGYPTDKTRCSDCDRRARAALQGEKL